MVGDVDEVFRMECSLGTVVKLVPSAYGMVAMSSLPRESDSSVVE
jgi:hypothetical protein